MGDVRLSDQGRHEEVERILGDGRDAVEAELYAARVAVDGSLFEAERRLSELTDVSPEALAARAAVLSPVLNVAFENPEALLNTYRRRFGNPTDRRLLEESARVVIDGRAGSDGGNSSTTSTPCRRSSPRRDRPRSARRSQIVPSSPSWPPTSTAPSASFGWTSTH